MPDETQTVLVADDEPMTPELIVDYLDCEVDLVRRDSDVFETLQTVDVAVIDPELMVSISDRAVAEIRPPDGYCTAAVVSETDPESDAIHVTCRERIEKPLDRRALRESIDRLRERARYDELLAEYASLAAKRGALDASHACEKLDSDPEYRAIERRLEEVLSELETITTGFDTDDFDAAFETPDFAGESRRRRIEWPA